MEGAKVTLTKARLAENLHREFGLNKREAMEIVKTFFETIITTLAGNETVKISGFGNFELQDKRARSGRNPKTGEAAIITARRVVKFRTGQKLKDRVKAYARAKK